jgi:hypothetical protein
MNKSHYHSGRYPVLFSCHKPKWEKP